MRKVLSYLLLSLALGGAVFAQQINGGAGGGSGAPTGAAGGDLSGTYPNPGVAKIVGVAPGTGVATALGVNVGSAGAVVVNGGALGTPSSGTATNLSGTAASLTAGTVTTNANLTGDVTSVGNATTLAAGSASNLNSGTLPAAAMGNAGTIRAKLIGANFNTTADQAITIALPTGSTNYAFVGSVAKISNPSISMTTAVCGLWTGPGKTGITVIGSSAVGVAMSGLTTSTPGSAGGNINVTVNNAATSFHTANPLYFACSTAQGATATADVTLTLTVLN